jgi:hypothetical protein
MDLRDGDTPESQRVTGVRIEDIVKHSETGDSLEVSYSSEQASYIKCVEDSIKHNMKEQWYQDPEGMDSEVSYEEYCDINGISSYIDMIHKIMEDIKDVPYRSTLTATIGRNGCSASIGSRKIEDAEKIFVERIVEQKGIYCGVLFLALRDLLVPDPRNTQEINEDFDCHIQKMKAIKDLISEHMGNGANNGIKDFLDGLDNSGLTEEGANVVKGCKLDKFMNMRRAGITLADIRSAVEEHMYGREEK